jgi:hypothetical protein
MAQIRERLDALRLEVSDVEAVERRRIAASGDMASPLWVSGLVGVCLGSFKELQAYASWRGHGLTRPQTQRVCMARGRAGVKVLQGAGLEALGTALCQNPRMCVLDSGLLSGARVRTRVRPHTSAQPQLRSSLPTHFPPTHLAKQVKLPFYALCWVLDNLYAKVRGARSGRDRGLQLNGAGPAHARPGIRSGRLRTRAVLLLRAQNRAIQKFWVLETVARIP